jgi:hypothetical protein
MRKQISAVAHKKTSLNIRAVTQRGRNREEAVSEEGTRAVPILVDFTPISHDQKSLSSFFRQILSNFLAKGAVGSRVAPEAAAKKGCTRGLR